MVKITAATFILLICVGVNGWVSVAGFTVLPLPGGLSRMYFIEI